MRLKLKIIWRKNFLGFALDQKSGQNSYPVTPYYFWPRTEAWDQLKLELDSKNIIMEEKIKILNLVTDVMNSWGQNKNRKTQKNYFNDVEYVEIQIGL